MICVLGHIYYPLKYRYDKLDSYRRSYYRRDSRCGRCVSIRIDGAGHVGSGALLDLEV